MKIRVGLGFDVHQLVEGRELWLGGIRLEHEKGLLGHSDADVLFMLFVMLCWELPICVTLVSIFLILPVSLMVLTVRYY